MQILILTNIENYLSASLYQLHRSSWHHLQQINSLFCLIDPEIIHGLGISQEEINELLNDLNDSIINQLHLKININRNVTQGLNDVFNHFIWVIDSFDVVQDYLLLFSKLSV